MSELAPRFAPDPETAGASRRRLAIAIAGALLAGAIAVASLSRDDEPTTQIPSTATPSQRSAPVPPPPTKPRDQQTGAVARLRDAADRFVDARRDAIEQLDVAQAQGADPRVVSAFATLLGVPAPAPPVDRAPAAAVPDEDEPPPALPPPDPTAQPPRAL